MYLSRIQLDTGRRSTMQALAMPKLLHGAIEASFPGERERRLWRVDYLNGNCYLLLVSRTKPAENLVAEQFGFCGGCWQSKLYAPLLERLQAGSIWQFRLTANPTKSCPPPKQDAARGTVHAHITTGYQEQWLAQRAQKYGFELLPGQFAVVNSAWLNFSKGAQSRQLTLLRVTYEGTLRVTEPDLFRKLLTEGIGRGKAYGMGLLTVRSPSGA